MVETELITIGTLPTTLAQRELFKSGILMKQWAESFPNIFDAQDIKIAVNRPDYHFYEWLAAITIWQSMGYLSLVEKYQFKKHNRQQEIIKTFLSAPLFELITNHAQDFGGTQAPDLFVYSPDNSDWFFCEVKGPRDSIRPSQSLFFEAISGESHKPIYVIRFIGFRGR